MPHALATACLLTGLLLACAPAAQATCHACLDSVLEDCTAVDVPDCGDSVAYMAVHYPGHAVEQVEGRLCELEGDCEGR